MATGLQVEQLQGYLANQTPISDRNNVLQGLQRLQTGLAGLTMVKSLLDTVVADSATAGQDEYSLAAVQADWAANLQSVVTSSFTLAQIAQLLADLSEQAGLDGTANEIRLYKNGVVIPVTQDA